MKFWNILSFVHLLCIASFGDGMEITTLKVDTPMIAGKTGWLKCDWNSKGDTLYSVKWYWGTDEFYRWSPKAETPVLIFNVSAFVVDPVRSRKGHVFVRNVSLRGNGVLRCEVSGEGPVFDTDHKDVDLKVVDLPDERPIIAVSRNVYDLHQIVALTCTSPRSKPAAVLDFYINDEKAETSWLVRKEPLVDEVTGLETAMLAVRFPLHPRLVRGGKVDIKCTARIDDLYWDSNDMNIYVDGIVPQRASRMEERATGSAVALGQSSIGLLGSLQILVLMAFHRILVESSL